MAILISHDHSHLTWQFSSHVAILISRTFSPRVRSHLTCSPPPLKVTSHPREVTLGPLYRVVPSTPQSHLACIFSPHIHILTSRTYSHLACPLHHSKSPRVHILTSCTHSHLTYIFSPHVLPSTQNNIFHLAWKNSQKSHAATPIPSISCLLRTTKNYVYLKKNNNK